MKLQQNLYGRGRIGMFLEIRVLPYGNRESIWLQMESVPLWDAVLMSVEIIALEFNFKFYQKRRGILVKRV